MRIQNHFLDVAIQKPSPNHGGVIVPQYVIMHYTAGWTASSAIATFASAAAKVSAQFTIDTDGTIYQHVATNRRAWHAGPSVYKGVKDLNSHSVGIELVNPGFLRLRGTNYVDSVGNVKTVADVGACVMSRYARAGSGDLYWPVYPPAQVAAALGVVKALMATYSIKDITGHEDIDTRGWKTDPGPAFDWAPFKALVGTEPECRPAADAAGSFFVVTANSLNVRAQPGGNHKIVRSIKVGTKVRDLGRAGAWVRIGPDEWVHSDYISAA